jgi:hypothetical protein
MSSVLNDLGLDPKELSWRWWRKETLLPLLQTSAVSQSPCSHHTPKPPNTWEHPSELGTWLWYTDAPCPRGPGYGTGYWYWHWYFSA